MTEIPKLGQTGTLGELNFNVQKVPGFIVLKALSLIKIEIFENKTEGTK